MNYNYYYKIVHIEYKKWTSCIIYGGLGGLGGLLVNLRASAGIGLYMDNGVNAVVECLYNRYCTACYTYQTLHYKYQALRAIHNFSYFLFSPSLSIRHSINILLTVLAPPPHPINTPNGNPGRSRPGQLKVPFNIISSRFVTTIQSPHQHGPLNHQ